MQQCCAATVTAVVRLYIYSTRTVLLLQFVVEGRGGVTWNGILGRNDVDCR